LAGQQHHVRQRQLLIDAVLLAQKKHALVNAFLHRQPLRLGAVGAVADQQQA
jgi:hypothetical protein